MSPWHPTHPTRAAPSHGDLQQPQCLLHTTYHSFLLLLLTALASHASDKGCTVACLTCCILNISWLRHGRQPRAKRGCFDKAHLRIL